MPDINHTSHDQVRDIVHEEIAPVKEDFKSIKRYAIGLLVTFFVASAGYGVWVGTIQTRVNHVEGDLETFEERVLSRLIRIEDKIDNIISK